MGTFRVDDVTPATEPLPTQPLSELFADALVIGGDPELPVVVPNGVHPLLGAVGRAFADHRPLVLSPDAVWLTITQGVAQHVRLHAEELRSRLVQHSGRKRLTVLNEGQMPQDAPSWRHIVELLQKQLAAEIADAELFECDFSTSTEVERVVGRIVLLDAYSPYFAVWMKVVCGIPAITLTGTVEDWQKIRARVDALAPFGLETWCRSLKPITDQFVRAAAGDVDTAFWQRIYSPIDAYGGEVITGWAARFYPYLESAGVINAPNPLLELPVDQPRDVSVPGEIYRGVGVRSDRVPATLSRVAVNVNDLTDRDNRVVDLHAGLVGVAQDDDGALRPVAGWYLAPGRTSIQEVIDRIIRDHDVTAPQPLSFMNMPAELIAVYERIGSATLFDGAWQLRPAARRPRLWLDDDRTVEAVIELADGRSICSVSADEAPETWWIVCRIEEDTPDSWRDRFRIADRPADVRVYGSSLALLLEAALDSGGDIAHLETGRLSE